MYRPIILFIGLRYVSRRSTDYFNNFVTWLSIIGITLGVMSLIIISSVMNGFKYKLQHSILSLTIQALISSTNGSLNPQYISKSKLHLHDITCMLPLTTADIVLQSANNIATGVMLGINVTQKDPLEQYFIQVKQTDLIPGQYNIILGEQLAKYLKVSCGDQLRVIIPSISYFTPIGQIPSQRLFHVIGTFSANNEVDYYQVLVNIKDASNMMHYPDGNITGWRLWLKEPLKIDNFNHLKLPKNIKWQDWRERKGDLFQAIHLETNTMIMLISLIIAVATFNVITSMSFMVIEKRSEIAILQTQGMTPYQIIAIFITYGAITSIIGIMLGSILGVLFVKQLNNFVFILRKFFDNAVLPVSIEPLQIISIAIITMIITLLSSFCPLWHAIKIQPTESLRYE